MLLACVGSGGLQPQAPGHFSSVVLYRSTAPEPQLCHLWKQEGKLDFRRMLLKLSSKVLQGGKLPELPFVSALLNCMLHTQSCLSSLHSYLDMCFSFGNWSSVLSQLGSCLPFQYFHCLTLRCWRRVHSWLGFVWEGTVLFVFSDFFLLLP